MTHAGYGQATLRVRTEVASGVAIPRYLTGKFCEHLGDNIYHGMDAQILRNPTFADYPFATGTTTPDGIATFHWEAGRIAGQLRERARRLGWPQGELDGLVAAREAGMASFWTRVGKPDAVLVSPDTGPHGGRAANRNARRAAGDCAVDPTALASRAAVCVGDSGAIPGSEGIRSGAFGGRRGGAVPHKRARRDFRRGGAHSGERWTRRPMRRPTLRIGWRLPRRELGSS